MKDEKSDSSQSDHAGHKAKDNDPSVEERSTTVRSSAAAINPRWTKKQK